MQVIVTSKSGRVANIQLTFEIIAFVLCVLSCALQFAVLDYYIVHYLANNWWLWLIVFDVGVIACLFWLLAIAIRYQALCSRTVCSSDSNIRYAFIGWLAYSLVLTVKVCIIFKLVVQHLKRTDAFGPGVLELTISGSCLIFLLLVLSHHFNDPSSHRQTLISYLSSSVTMDVIDSVVFLKLLLDPRFDMTKDSHQSLATVILFLACFNFIMPTCSLFKLRYNFSLPRWLPFPFEKLYSLFYMILVNAPFLVIRLFIWTDDDNPVTTGSVFMVKNIVMLIVGIRELWVSYIFRQEQSL